MPQVRLSQLTKTYAANITAVRDLELTVHDGERLVLVGPSGCGKSTTLRLIAGLERPDRGRVYFDDQDVTSWAAGKRHVGMIFQGENHFPHLNVQDNLAIGLRMRGVDAGTVERRVAAAARVLGLEPLLERWPQDLSGGQRQRVALGRLLADQAPVCLLDEPLSNIDPALRSELREAIRALHRQTGATLIYVTHDQVEAMTLGERIAVMEGGTLLQVDTPAALYQSPANTFVAQFIGSPAMNLLPAEIRQGRLWLAEGQVELAVRAADGPVTLGIRPERLILSDAEPIRLTGQVEAVEYLGAEQIVRLSDQQRRFAARLPATPTFREGDELTLGCTLADAMVFAADATGRRLGTLAEGLLCS